MVPGQCQLQKNNKSLWVLLFPVLVCSKFPTPMKFQTQSFSQGKQPCQYITNLHITYTSAPPKVLILKTQVFGYCRFSNAKLCTFYETCPCLESLILVRFHLFSFYKQIKLYNQNQHDVALFEAKFGSDHCLDGRLYGNCIYIFESSVEQMHVVKIILTDFKHS